MNNFTPSLGLFADLYELTMAQAYWQSGTVAPATFSFFVRTLPPDRGYLVCAGLEDVLDYLERFHFTAEDIAYLRSLRRFKHQFLTYLAQLRFTGSVQAMPEGSIFFANEPVMEVVRRGRKIDYLLLARGVAHSGRLGRHNALQVKLVDDECLHQLRFYHRGGLRPRQLSRRF